MNKREKAILAKVDAAVNRLTIFRNFAQLCEAPFAPTLSVNSEVCHTEQDREDMRLLRVLYKEATGKTPAK